MDALNVKTDLGGDTEIEKPEEDEEEAEAEVDDEDKNIAA